MVAVTAIAPGETPTSAIQIALLEPVPLDLLVIFCAYVRPPPDIAVGRLLLAQFWTITASSELLGGVNVLEAAVVIAVAVVPAALIAGVLASMVSPAVTVAVATPTPVAAGVNSDAA
jgi:hypothetical protein